MHNVPASTGDGQADDLRRHLWAADTAARAQLVRLGPGPARRAPRNGIDTALAPLLAVSRFPEDGPPDRDAFVAYLLRRFVSAWYTQPAQPMEGGSTIVGHIINEIEHGTRTVAGIPVSVRELVWDDDSDRNSGRSFEVHRVDTGEDLTEDECFDTMPADEQIADRLAHRQPDWWICRGSGSRFDARTQSDLIVDHVQIFCDLVDGAGNPIAGAS